MLHALLVRKFSDDEGTLGQISIDGRTVCYINELPWRENRSNISCIPAGTYLVKYLARSASSKYRDVYHVQAVPGRGGILIHSGNWAGDTAKGFRADSWGCLLPGKRVGRLAGQRAVLTSSGALALLHAATGRKSFMLEIRNA